eukprot:3354540-Pyramimonas_sp.AAC.1
MEHSRRCLQRVSECIGKEKLVGGDTGPLQMLAGPPQCGRVPPRPCCVLRGGEAPLPRRALRVMKPESGGLRVERLSH